MSDLSGKTICSLLRLARERETRDTLSARSIWKKIASMSAEGHPYYAEAQRHLLQAEGVAARQAETARIEADIMKYYSLLGEPKPPLGY